MKQIYFLVFAYLSGSILYGRLFGKWIGHVDIKEVSPDHNPGTANAFVYGGFFCGVITIICELLKGAIPVYWFCMYYPQPDRYLTLMLILPVLGHAFSVFYGFSGGKAIAVSFGVLIGLFPDWKMLGILIVYYLIFSFFKLNPHSFRTIVTFSLFVITVTLYIKDSHLIMGAWGISGIVIGKHIYSDYYLPGKGLKEKINES